MNRILKWISENMLFGLSLFLLAFIPLYPKLPVVGVQHTWVYVRLEDFLVLFTILTWVILFFRRKVTLKTPLTLPFIIYWIVGGLATLHGVMLIFPTISNVFSNVAFLSYLRRIEYMSLFFIAFTSMRDKKAIAYVAGMLAVVLLAIVGYGFGQHYLGFPAFLTMNEEFAKGVPIQLSELTRVPSTFAGQYDLAAYLVLVIPLLVSLAFGFKNWLMRILLFASSALGFALLILTVSRVSFVVLLLSLVLLLIMQKKKIIILSLLAFAVVLLAFSPRIVQRFGNTVSEVTVLVDAKTGDPVGQVKQVPASYFQNMTIFKQNVSPSDATNSAATLALGQIPKQAELVLEPNIPNGETLPQGTSYINLPLSPVARRVGEYFYQKSPHDNPQMNQANVYFGDFVVKQAKAYDLSFTTRFQGEWPNTILAFSRNVLFGSGYGSVTLAVDNDYLRLLGETGMLGLLSFFGIFLVAGIYIRKLLPKVDSPLVKSYILGFVAGTFGLALNAILIDVFEASKVAFVYWILMGITLGTLYLYKKEDIDILKELKKAIVSPYAITLYILVIAFVLFSSTTSNYFVGDDFTWFRWAADCGTCSPFPTILHYFTQSSGFFYRPGTKTYFYLMYSLFWLNQTPYHLVSIFLHFAVTAVLFFIALRVFRNRLLAATSALLFLALSGYSEIVLWTAATGHLISSLFVVLSLLFFMLWQEKKQTFYYAFSFVSIIVSLAFYELGIIAPILVVAYAFVQTESFSIKKVAKKWEYLLLFTPLLPYFIVRAATNSHWLNGDYSYNIAKLPFNIIGNTIGYFVLSLVGSSSLPLYETARDILRSHILLAAGIVIVACIAILFVYKLYIRKIGSKDKEILSLGFIFFTVPLLLTLGLGNITARYSYLAAFGFIILFVFFLEKVYQYLLDNGRNIAIGITSVIIIVFTSAQLFQLQKTQFDWIGAGNQSMNILTSLSYIYAHYPLDEAERLYFVDVPIKNGDAWVFPVGLSDAVWLVFRSDAIKIYQEPSVDHAFADRGDQKGLIFQFAQNGSLVEKRKTITGQIESIPLNK